MTRKRASMVHSAAEAGSPVPSHRVMQGKPRLLFLCQTLPFPPDGGVNIRSYHTLRLLAQHFDVTALCFFRAATRTSPQDIKMSLDGLSGFGRVESFPIPQEHSRLRLIWDHIRSVGLRRPYTVYAYDSGSYRRRLQELLRGGRFDLVHMDSLDLSRFLPLLDRFPVVCVHHNVESELLRRRANTEDRRIRALYLRHQANLLEREERWWCERVALNVAVSDIDRGALAELAPHASFVVVPNGVDTDIFRPVPDAGQGVVFVGGLSWFPNRDGLGYFCEEILPRLRERGADVRVDWVGRASEEDRRFYRAKHRIRLTGYVDDIKPYVHNAACFVVPLRVGSGTRLKILDAWAMGKAVVSTSIGCEGLDALDGENILIRDTPDGFAEAVHRVLQDSDLRARLGANARLTVESTYSWKVIGEVMVRRYRAVIEEWQKATSV